jgi:hypothetical protein
MIFMVVILKWLMDEDLISVLKTLYFQKKLIAVSKKNKNALELATSFTIKENDRIAAPVYLEYSFYGYFIKPDRLIESFL